MAGALTTSFSGLVGNGNGKYGLSVGSRLLFSATMGEGVGRFTGSV